MKTFANLLTGIGLFGKAQALRHYRVRFQCTKCGRWSTSSPIRKPQVKEN